MRIAQILITGLFVSLLSACASSQIYSGSKSAATFVAIPKGWQKISQEEIHQKELSATSAAVKERAAAVVFQEGYSFGYKATASEVLSAKTPKTAIVFLRVRDLNGDEMNSVSYNWLRDVIFPITSWLGSNNSTPQWQLLDDQENVQKGARGVTTIYSIQESEKVSQTISQTAVVSDDRTRMYVLLIRANSTWYNEHKSVVKRIADSFTVRGK